MSIMLLDLKHPAFKRDLSKVRRCGLDRHLNAVCALRYYMQKNSNAVFSRCSIHCGI
ncbi:hypothetical protein EPHNCH_0838 [Anaplasma phagocytophilum str. NCH-1]|uniref:Uncharacterized protein n=2 Tax=Anaplasma phagocytophilum TaxID=948 RepID=A0A0F3NDF4_ANAPH|nr:hypothetical protein EPHNCH_0838 [Anaplasma phagocytophilum str. NCH-1]